MDDAMLNTVFASHFSDAQRPTMRHSSSTAACDPRRLDGMAHHWHTLYKLVKVCLTGFPKTKLARLPSDAPSIELWIRSQGGQFK